MYTLAFAVVLLLSFSSKISGSANPSFNPSRALSKLSFSSRSSNLNKGTVPFDPHDSNFPVIDRDRNGHPHLPQRIRPRRNRKSVAMRALVREHSIKPDNLVYPIFIEESDKSVGFTFKGKGNRVPIASMPGIYRHDLASMMQEIQESVELGIKSFVLFPHVAEGLKNNMGSESYNPNGIVPRAIKMIKAKFPHVVVITDVALDPYSSMGHDGVVEEERILNDITVQQLQKQAVMHARAGADMVSPSDMMDGRIGAIRDALDSEGFSDVGILSYSAKYASAFYGPFRDALDSHPGFGDKKTYQMDPSNSREATTEALLDVSEGADMLMVKPGMPYLDVIRRLHSTTNVPIAAYQVSGEYAMLKAAAQKGWLDEKKAVTEALIGFKRAGADVVFTYYAKEFARWVKQGLVSFD